MCKMAALHCAYLLLFARFAFALEFSFMETLLALNANNASVFTMIQEHSGRPGTLVAYLSNSIVMFDVKNPQNLRPFAGTPNFPGYATGTGSQIRFSEPWGLAQLPNNYWWITDSGNNCLRRLDFAKNSANRPGTNAIDSISVSCDSTKRRSDVRDTLSESSFYRPRGLTYYAPKNVVYLTYEEPYALAEINLHGGNVKILFSSNFWPLRRVIPFSSEIVISTHPKDLLFSYRESKLGTIINREWRNNTPPISDSQSSYTSGIAVLPGYTTFIQTMSDQNVLVLVNQEKKLNTKVCSGTRGHNDGNLNGCQLDSPRFVTLINDTIYIGEQGTSGGGIRTIRITDFYKPTTQAQDHVTPVAASVPVVVAVIIVAVIVGVCVYRRKKRKSTVSPTPTIPMQPSDGRPVPPIPRPRTYAEISENYPGREHVYAEIDYEDQMKYMNSEGTSTVPSSSYSNFSDNYLLSAKTAAYERTNSVMTQVYTGPDMLHGVPVPAPRKASSLDRDGPLKVDISPVEANDGGEEMKISDNATM